MSVESCSVCGFVWDDVTADEVGPGILGTSAAIAERLRHGGPTVLQRPAPDRWSAVEYAAHVRDVLAHVRDRLILTLVEDDPQYALLWRDERVDLGLYAGDDPAVVATELEVLAGLYVRTFGRIDPAQYGRTGLYVYPTESRRSILWIAAQTLHECRHHLADIDEGLAELG